MSTAEDEEFEKAFEGFGEEATPTTPKKEDVPVELPKEDPKPNDEPAVEKPEDKIPPVEDEKKPEEGVDPPKDPETPPEVPETPQPLTKDDVTSVISELLQKERTSGQELESTTKEVLDAYYPEGLSNVLIDERTGKELRTFQDVVDASGGAMSIEEAAQWLMNEQHKLDGSLSKIKDDARNIAETTVNFKRDAMAALQKYEPLFKEYPLLQDKVYQKLMKQVKVDEKHNVILSAPDVMEHYDDYLEPYQLAYEYSTKRPATNAAPPVEPPKPSTEDRMDEYGDGGASPVNDPDDFAQQVNKELSKPL